METLQLALGPSQRLAALLTMMHGWSAVMLWVVPLPPSLAFPATLALAASLAWTLRRDALRHSPDAIVTLTLYADWRCEFQTRGGATHEARLLDTSFVAPWLTILNLKVDGHRLPHHAVILKDSIDAEAFRKLRVRLKWGHPGS